MSCFLGVDVGTSSVKLVIIDKNGTIIRKNEKSYPYLQPMPDWSEIRPDVWIQAVEEGLEELLENFKCKEIRSIGFTGQMHTTVFLDEQGQCIRPAIMWNDRRTKELVPFIKQQIAGKKDAKSILRILSTGSPATNLLWLRQYEPENFARLAKFLIGPDYLVYYFSGQYSTDYCEASTSSLYDVEAGNWSESMRKILALSESTYPPIRGSQEIVGFLSERFQRKYGMSDDVAIIVGTGDNPAAAMATGALNKQYPVLSIGTSGVLVLVRNEINFESKGKHILFSQDGVEIQVLVQGVIQSAGGSYQWYVKSILEEDNFESLTDSVDLNRLGEDELLFYPHLMGDKTIYGDPNLRGAFIGLTAKHTRSDLAVSIMEGICFGVKQLMEQMSLTKEEKNGLKVTGGGSRSKVWMQIMADILGVSVEQLDAGDGASLGIALMARNALVKDKQKTNKERLPKSGGVFRPREYHTRKYEKKYQRYLRVYDALKMIDS